MYSVTKIIDFCYGHRLLNYEGKCRFLHGHNCKVEITLQAEQLDGLGMVRDFSEIKNKIQKWIDANLDHKMILCNRDPVLPLLRNLSEPFYVINENPTAENIAKLIFEEVTRLKFPVESVRLWETDKSVATYTARSIPPVRRVRSPRTRERVR